MSAVMPDRRATVADAAIAVLAAQGMRGLTHRAVDRAAGLPIGSTSYYARTRAALLELTLQRIAELDGAQPQPQVPAEVGFDELAEGMIGYLRAQLTEGRQRSLARYEFAIEASRRAELRAIYDRAGAGVRAAAEGYLAAAGSVEPKRHARVLIAWLDGMVFDALAGSGGPIDDAELVAGVRDVLGGILQRPRA